MIAGTPALSVWQRIVCCIFLIIILLIQMIHSVHASQGTPQTLKQATTNRLSPLGINTNEVLDMDASVPFVDLYKLAMPFDEARPWLTKGHIEYDARGWPKNLHDGQAGTRFINNFPAKSIPNATYTVTYKGRGKIIYGGNAQLVRHLPGKDLITIRANKNKRITATLVITESDPENYIRDIKVLMPGGICKKNPYTRVHAARDCKNDTFLSFINHSEEIVFNPDYLNFMKDFRVIRFMNMSGITRNNLSHWGDRPQLTDASWGGKEGSRGAPLEVMVKLANILNIDPWFNLPHRADDDFVRQYARYVKTHLKPHLKAYIEYTNEAWNGVFSQAHYMMDQGQTLKLDVNRTYAGWKYYSKRSVEIFRIWEEEFGNTNRLVRVMGGLASNIPLTHIILGYNEAFRYTDALAVAPYFYIPQKLFNKVESVSSVFELLRSPRNPNSVPATLEKVKQQARIVGRYGIDLIAYEGGQHLVSYKTHHNDEDTNPILIKANKDQRMAKLYYNFLQGWKEAGGKLFVAFSAPRAYNWIGSWGIKEYITQNQDIAPKYRGLMYFQKTERCWWYGCATIGFSRHSKPAFNPGAGEIARRSKAVTKKKPPLLTRQLTRTEGRHSKGQKEDTVLSVLSSY